VGSRRAETSRQHAGLGEQMLAVPFLRVRLRAFKGHALGMDSGSASILLAVPGSPQRIRPGWRTRCRPARSGTAPIPKRTPSASESITLLAEPL